jgi:hypothetical protein
MSSTVTASDNQGYRLAKKQADKLGGQRPFEAFPASRLHIPAKSGHNSIINQKTKIFKSASLIAHPNENKG